MVFLIDILAVRDHIQVMKVKIIRVIHFALKWFAVRHISQIYDNPGYFRENSCRHMARN